MTQTKYQPTELSLRVRALLKEGRPIPEIMALTGAQRQVVGVIKYHMERQEKARISPATGKVLGKVPVENSHWQPVSQGWRLLKTTVTAVLHPRERVDPKSCDL